MKSESLNFGSSNCLTEDINYLYHAIYEGSKIDQDGDGNNDGADVMIARMVASGMPKEEAIRRTRNKSYNKESYDMVHDIVEELVDEGYDLSDYTWDEMYAIVEETLQDKQAREEEIARRRARVSELTRQGRVMTSSKRTSQKTRQRAEERRQEELEKAAQAAINQIRGASGRVSERPMGSQAPEPKAAAPTATRRLRTGLRRDTLGSAADEILRNIRNEDYDLYNLVLDHLIEEGFADDYESANTMIEYMSEEWLDDILNEEMPAHLRGQSLSDYNKSQREQSAKKRERGSKEPGWKDRSHIKSEGPLITKNPGDPSQAREILRGTIPKGDRIMGPGFFPTRTGDRVAAITSSFTRGEYPGGGDPQATRMPGERKARRVIPSRLDRK